MIAYAAVDVHAGHVVQLVGGDTGDARVVLDDPTHVAMYWQTQGFPALHVVDLDAALGTGENRELITAALKAVDIPVQIGGGIRSEDDVAYWIEAGASQVIIGTRALEDRGWLRNVAARNAGKVIVAADVRDGFVVTHGWQVKSPIPVAEYVQELNEIALGGVLVTDVNREGRLLGADADMFRGLARLCDHPLIASGGIRGNEDLGALADAKVAGAILGMALYTDAIDIGRVRELYTR
jgi:phosphoribosylformimino-5-aminoimidazole carboxamide ribotide isomerase